MTKMHLIFGRRRHSNTDSSSQAYDRVKTASSMTEAVNASVEDPTEADVDPTIDPTIDVTVSDHPAPSSPKIQTTLSPNFLTADKARERTRVTVKRVKRNWLQVLSGFIEKYTDSHVETSVEFNPGLMPGLNVYGDINGHFLTLTKSNSLFDEIPPLLGKAGYIGYILRSKLSGREVFSYYLAWAEPSMTLLSEVRDRIAQGKNAFEVQWFHPPVQSLGEPQLQHPDDQDDE